jgi:hypothetical protein
MFEESVDISISKSGKFLLIQGDLSLLYQFLRAFDREIFGGSVAREFTPTFSNTFSDPELVQDGQDVTSE